MKKYLYLGLVSAILVTSVILTPPSPALGWSQSFHAYVAKESLELNRRYIASYNARLGSIVPDFFWLLQTKGLITPEEAYLLHGATEQGCVSEATTYFYMTAAEMIDLEPWFYRRRLSYFVEGIGTHVYADITAHDPDDGYVVQWIDIFMSETPWVDAEALHLALEFAVDALLVHQKGLQLGDLLFCYMQSNYVEEVVEELLGDPGFDVSREFNKYLTLMRLLEKLAGLYTPYLTGETDGMDLVLSDEILLIDSDVLTILLYYPEQIYETLTGDVHWETALDEAIDFCQHPVYCW